MSDVDQIKAKIDIVAYISESVPLKKTGANFKGLCPFHSEKTPSFVVSAERQIWHCFGGCQDGGDIFKFLMKTENIEFGEALRILAKRAGVTLSGSYQNSHAAELKEKIYTVNHLASEFYHYILTDHKLGENARKYLENRQITNNSITLFSIGYAPNSWDSLTGYLTKKGYSTLDLDTAGLVSKSGIGNYFDRFRGRLIFTLKDHHGNIVGFAGRLLDPEAKEAKYVNTAETAVYVKGNVLYGLDVTREEIKKAGFAVVVEGEIDAIASYQAGVRNVVAIKGSALTEGQVKLLKRYTENIYLSLDADFAGDAAAHRGIMVADSEGMNIKVVVISGAKDPDELIKKNSGLWRKAIEEAVPFYDYIIDSAVNKYDPKSPDGAKKIVSETAKYLGPIENLVVREHYLKKLAEKLQVPQEVLENQLTKEFKRDLVGGRKEIQGAAKETKGRVESLEEYLLSLLLQSHSPSDYLLLISPRLLADDFTIISLGKIYSLLVSLVDNPKSDVTLPTRKFSIKDFVKVVPPELLPIVDRLYLEERKVNFDDETEVLEEISKTVWDIKELSLREKLREISGKIKTEGTKEQEQDFAKVSTALQKLFEEKGLIGKTA